MHQAFLGSERVRKINLGGSSSTHSQQQILDAVRQQREQRQDQRRRQESARKLQAWWRGRSEAKRYRNLLRNTFDTTTGPIVDWTRLLVLGWGGSADDHERLGRWSRTILQAAPDSLNAPFQTSQRDSWFLLLRRVAMLLLTVAGAHPLSIHAVPHLQVISYILSPQQVSVLDLTDHVLRKGLYHHLSKGITNTPLESKTSPSLPLLTKLTAAPFEIIAPTSLSFSNLIHDFCSQIMSIPILPNRLPLDVLRAFSSQVPIAHLDKLRIQELTDSLTDDSKLHLMANLLVFVPPRLPKLGNAVVGAYLELMTYLINSLPAGTFDPAHKANMSARSGGNIGPDDSDGEETPFTTSTEATRWPDDPMSAWDSRTRNRLQIIPSPSHIGILVELTSKDGRSRQKLFPFLLTTFMAWPSKKDTIAHCARSAKGGSSIIKEVWRNWVRSSKLGRKADPGSDWMNMIDPNLAPWWPPFLFLVEIYSQDLLTMGDDEFFATSVGSTAPRNPLTLDELTGFSKQLLNIAFPLYWNEDQDIIKDGFVPGMKITWRTVRDMLTNCLKLLHERDSRRKFTPDDHWLMTSNIDIQSFVEAAVYEEAKLDDNISGVISKRQLAYISPRLGVLNNIPFCIPFPVRVKIFRHFVLNDMSNLGLNEPLGRPRHKCVVRRHQVARDGYDGLYSLGRELKGRIQITFLDQWGNEEMGIDGGGVFKEFLTSLSKEVFDTDHGLWLATSRQELYPNPHTYAREAHQLNWYRFIGRILGKALYDGILVDVAFASFFLAKWLGRQSYLDDLASLDPELYKGLIYLKHYEGNVEDLALNFTVNDNDLGVTTTKTLLPNGKNIPVTNENRLQYITLVSHYRLNAQIKQQCAAFFEGLSDIIRPNWLRMFNQQELQILISGTEDPINVDDLERNTIYGGVFDASHDTIRMFWSVIRSLDQKQRCALLRFVTSCARPPLLGFKELYPKFSIRDAGSDESRLPTSSTCVNLLKLPVYKSPAVLKQKLLQAIHSGAGFDLS
ncbi:hypothetical protein FRC02_006739 [Tulasnella sp. 418]|nr:hypothetical protein FRC02_006739 [Tulasnella sp. 418]